MTALGHLGRWDSPTFAKNVEFVLLPVHRPTFFKRLGLLGVGNAESHERQKHCTYADKRLPAFTNVPTLRIFRDRGADALLESNALEHRVQAIGSAMSQPFPKTILFARHLRPSLNHCIVNPGIPVRLGACSEGKPDGIAG